MSVATAIYAAAVAGFLNILAAVYNQRAQRRLERDKADAADQLEREKTEATRILEMIKTGGDLRAAENNPQFLVQTGLISENKWGAKIVEFVKNHNAPVLPASNGPYRIEATDALSAASRTLLQTSLDEYCRYAEEVGFAGMKDSKPTVRIEYDEKMAGWLSQYVPNTGVIRIARSMEANIDSPRREYTHHILGIKRPDQNMNYQDLYLLESDLADYFVGSFADRPELNVGTPVFRTLINQETFEAVAQPNTAWRERREVWGGAFWAIRSKLGREVTDKILRHGVASDGPGVKRRRCVGKIYCGTHERCA
jgi:hypothetical protein